MREITADKNLVAACGLYCGACKAYLHEACPGCSRNEKATWCQVRKCCQENNIQSCADCMRFMDIKACKKFNGFLFKIVGWILKADRKRCIMAIKEQGYLGYAERMAQDGKQFLPRQ